MQSLPSRERGLKSARQQFFKNLTLVAPLAGAWIEINYVPDTTLLHSVAPLAGAWIEIFVYNQPYIHYKGRSPRGSVD